MGEHLHVQAGPACELTGGELIRWRSLFAPTGVITMALYAAAAPLDDGCGFDPDDFANVTH